MWWGLIIPISLMVNKKYQMLVLSYQLQYNYFKIKYKSDQNLSGKKISQRSFSFH